MGRPKAPWTAATEAELVTLLQSAMTAGESPAPGLMAAALKASKPKRTPKPPKVPANPDVTYIKRTATNLAKVTAQIDSAKRYIYELNSKGDPFASRKSLHCTTLYANLPTWTDEAVRLASDLARAVKDHFSSPNDTESTPQ